MSIVRLHADTQRLVAEFQRTFNALAGKLLQNVQRAGAAFLKPAMDNTLRQELIDAKARLGGREFVVLHAEACLASSNADLLNDIPFVPRSWFRDWTGYCNPYWKRPKLSGLSAQDALKDVDVWCIESDPYDELTAEVYLEARGALLLEEARLDANHWLMQRVKRIKSEQVIVRSGDVLHADPNPPLAHYSVRLVLVDTLVVTLEGEPGEYDVYAVRKDDTLYLTPRAGEANVTWLVSDYIIDNRYSRLREDEDRQVIRLFISVGVSPDYAHTVSVLLPESLRLQPRLAGVKVELTYDDEGKLQSIHA
jgi:hypothetical protein